MFGAGRRSVQRPRWRYATVRSSEPDPRPIQTPFCVGTCRSPTAALGVPGRCASSGSTISLNTNNSTRHADPIQLIEQWGTDDQASRCPPTPATRFHGRWPPVHVEHHDGVPRVEWFRLWQQQRLDALRSGTWRPPDRSCGFVGPLARDRGRRRSTMSSTSEQGRATSRWHLVEGSQSRRGGHRGTKGSN